MRRGVLAVCLSGALWLGACSDDNHQTAGPTIHCFNQTDIPTGKIQITCPNVSEEVQ